MTVPFPFAFPLVAAGALTGTIILFILIGRSPYLTFAQKRACHVALLLGAMLFISFVLSLPLTGKTHEKTRRIVCGANLHALSYALECYANDNGGSFPEADGVAGLERLRARVEVRDLQDPRAFLCPTVRGLPTLENAGFLRFAWYTWCWPMPNVRPPESGPLTEEYCDYVYRGGLTIHSSPDEPVVWDKVGNHSRYGNVLYLDGRVVGLDGDAWTRFIETHRQDPTAQRQTGR